MVAFLANKALLALQASALASEASAAGLTSLATALSAFSPEIEQAITEAEFFGNATTDSAALVWAQTLSAAAAIIQTSNINRIREDFVMEDSAKFWESISSIANDIRRIRNLGDRDQDGLGFRTIQPGNELSLAILWLLYIERGKILDLDLDSATINDLLTQSQEGSPELRQASLDRLNQLLTRLRNSGLGNQEF